MARREIGALASSKNITRAQKVVAPSQKERPQRFVRSQINFNTLDHVGHGTKVVDKSQVIDDRYKKEVSVCGTDSGYVTHPHVHTCVGWWCEVLCASYGM